jgi:hypothetical protein
LNTTEEIHPLKGVDIMGEIYIPSTSGSEVYCG